MKGRIRLTRFDSTYLAKEKLRGRLGRDQKVSPACAGMDRPCCLTTAERQRVKELEREVRDLKRTNEILRKASAYFAQAELDRRPR